MTNPYTWLMLPLAGAVATYVAAAVAINRLAQSTAVIRFIDRLAEAAVALARAVTPLGAAVVAGTVGFAAAVGVLWPVGWLARNLESSVDEPVLAWAGQHHDTAWADLNEVVTVMGNNRPIQIIVLLSSAALAMLWRRRVWWIPVVVVPGTYAAARIGQVILENVIGRNLPPTSAGDFPSGGVARVIAVYGVVVILLLVGVNASRRLMRSALLVVLMAGVVEAYTRAFLQKHWLTDAAAGLLFGLLVLGAAALALWVLLRAYARPPNDRIKQQKLVTT